MQENIQKSLDVVKDKWNSLTSKQKIQIVSIGVILIVALFLTISLTTRPTWKVLATDLDVKTTYALKTALDEAKIGNKVVQNETAISVLEKDFETARNVVISSGVTNDSFTFADALGSMTMGTTSDVKKQIMNQSKQSEIESALQRIDGVEKAKVTLFVPDDTNFYLEAKQEATAAVLLTLKKDLSEEQVNAIVKNVMTSVSGLKKKNIEVMDDKANVLYSGEENIDGSVSANYRLEVQKRQDIENKAKAFVLPMFNDVKILSNIVLDFNTYAESEETFSTPIADATVGIPQRESVNTSSVKSSSAANEPGLTANGGNVTQYPATANPAGSDAKSEDRSTDYALNKKQTTTQKPTGTVLYDQSSMSIVGYKFRTYYEEDAEAQGLLQDMTWKQYQEQIESNPQVPLAIDAAVITNIQNGTGITNLSLMAYELPKFVDKPPTTARPIDQYVILTILVLLIGLLAFGLIRRTAPAEVTEITPELSVEEVLETFSKRQEYVSPIDYDSESEVKKQIEKFVDERPEAVAQLLRNWLSSEWE